MIEKEIAENDYEKLTPFLGHFVECFNEMSDRARSRMWIKKRCGNAFKWIIIVVLIEKINKSSFTLLNASNLPLQDHSS